MIINYLKFNHPAIFIALRFLFVAVLLVACNTFGQIEANTLQKKIPCTEPIPIVFDRVSPAVVFIIAKSINPYLVSDRVESTLGTGFIVDRSGIILTNSHVVYGRPWIAVTLDDGTSLPAQLLGADPLFDLAVIKIPVPSGRKLPTVALGDSSLLRVGEDVVAIGNPLGLNQTLTRGVVSAINRIIPMNPFSPPRPLIQTDTPINPGNSGGPLLNMCGEAIGINTAAIASAENIGFSIPINLAKALLPSLLEYGRVIRPWIGFQGQFIDRDLQELLKIPLVEGFLVEVVEPESPAEQAGLLGGQFEFAIDGVSFLIGGDIITSINGIPLDSSDKVADVAETLKIGSTVKLTVYREGTYQKVEYDILERPVLPWDILIGHGTLITPVERNGPSVVP